MDETDDADAIFSLCLQRRSQRRMTTNIPWITKVSDLLNEFTRCVSLLINVPSGPPTMVDDRFVCTSFSKISKSLRLFYFSCVADCDSPPTGCHRRGRHDRVYLGICEAIVLPDLCFLCHWLRNSSIADFASVAHVSETPSTVVEAR